MNELLFIPEKQNKQKFQQPPPKIQQRKIMKRNYELMSE